MHSFDPLGQGPSSSSSLSDREDIHSMVGLTEQEYVNTVLNQEEDLNSNTPRNNEDDQVDEYNVYDKTKCTFYFKGEYGAEWFTERYIDVEKNCLVEMATVKANNPKATILKIVQNYVHDPIADSSKYKCTYLMRGEYGAIWFTERYVISEAECRSSELEIVKGNNPKATILKIISNYVSDAINYTEKYKCSYNFLGEKGAVWFTERYVHNESECKSSELLIVRGNNPKAVITEIITNFVNDPIN